MIAACWIVLAATSALYALVLDASTELAQAAAPVYVLLAVAAWLVLAIHHNRRHR